MARAFSANLNFSYNYPGKHYTQMARMSGPAHQSFTYIPGLDRFAQFFIAPLMKKEAMQREREAVDSEFQMSLPSDYCRKEQIFGSLAKDKHPMTKFMWGNLTSLQMGQVS